MTTYKLLGITRAYIRTADGKETELSVQSFDMSPPDEPPAYDAKPIKLESLSFSFDIPWSAFRFYVRIGASWLPVPPPPPDRVN